MLAGTTHSSNSVKDQQRQVALATSSSFQFHPLEIGEPAERVSSSNRLGVHSTYFVGVWSYDLPV